MSKQNFTSNARQERFHAKKHTVRKERVFEQYSFDSSTLEVFALAEIIARRLDEAEVYCSHVFAACVLLEPEILHKILGRKVEKLPEKFDTERPRPSYAGQSLDDIDFSREFASIFFDNVPGTPFQFVKDYFPGSQIGVAQILFAILMEPTQEIADILMANGFSNDANLLSGLLRENYLKNLHALSAISHVERRERAMSMADKFERIMNHAVTGQDVAISKVASSLTNFWCKGNEGCPYVILLLSKQGGGRSFFADRMQQAFVELGLQGRIEPPVDMSGFVHPESCEASLLGDEKTYKCAKNGLLFKMQHSNKRGMMVFEDILNGDRNAKNILRSFTQNLANDKFANETLILPMNVIVMTMQLTDEEYRFFNERTDKELNSTLLNSILLQKDGKLTAEAYSSSAVLWQRADSIVLLRQLDEEQLKKLAVRRVKTLERSIKNDYDMTLKCNDIMRMVSLAIQSSPEELCPKKLIDTIDDVVQEKRLWQNIRHNPSLQNYEIVIPELPVYPHEPERRIARGDYLDFKKNEEVVGTTMRLTFSDIHYKQRDRIDCADYRIEHPKGTSFQDIIGLDDVRDELLDALDYITGSDEYRASLPPPCLNFILYGPPGTGKTSLAVALANSADIPVFFAPSSIFTNTAKLSDMFRKASEMAPAIVVLEEFNSIGDSSNPRQREAINELNSILDGVKKQMKILVLASTNYLEQIEGALRRTGRFGRQIKIDLPVAEARERFIRAFELKFKIVLDECVRSSFVEATEGVNFADLKGILEFALRRSVRAKKQLDSCLLEAALREFQGNRISKSGIGFNAERAI